MSSTTRCRPLTEPGVMSVIGPIPVPKTMAQLDPGGVSCDDAHRLTDLGVDHIAEPDLFVERLGPVHVGYRHGYQFQPHVRDCGIICHRTGSSTGR